MNIGQAARSSGVSAKMIRYYEQIALIPRADRKESGYRDYSDNDVHVLRFIRRARDLGFSVAEIQDLLGLWRNKCRHSSEVKQIARNHIETLEQKIRNLQDMTATLKELVESCHGDQRSDCPIIDRLETDAADEDFTPHPRSGAV